MGRIKKNDSEKLVAVAREYYETEGAGNPSNLKCSNFARYGKQHGCSAEAYDFRRDSAVRMFVEAERKKVQALHSGPLQASYRNLDVDTLLRESRTMEAFKRTLREMDTYWHSVYDAAVQAEEQSVQALCRAVPDEQAEQLKDRINRLEGELAQAKTSMRHLEGECRYLKGLLRKYLYPAVAEELLRQEKLPVPDNTAVKKDAFDILIEGKFPMNYEGKQGGVKRKESRQERLFSLMKEQVSDGE